MKQTGAKKTLTLGFLTFFYVVSSAFVLYADDDKVTLKCQNAPLRTALQKLARQTRIDIVYADELVENLTVTCDFEKMPLQQALKQILQDKPVTFRVVNEKQIVLVWQKNQSKALITGKVIDGDTGLPLENVNVFLANTMMGSATNSNGQFRIRNVPRGRFELIVSMIGYAVIKTKITVSDTMQNDIVFKLHPKPYQAPEIVVSAADMEKWRKNLSKFTEHFLGTSKNAAECTLLNSEVLDFEKKGGLLSAVAHAPLQIENKALGFLVHFNLEEFSCQDNEINYLGYMRFEELTPKSLEEKKKWRQNRRTAYNGSLRHFLTASFNNRLQEEGFYLYEAPERNKDNRNSFRERVTKPRFLYYNRSPFDPQFHLEREVRFKDYLEVVYTGELEEEGYVDYRMSQRRPRVRRGFRSRADEREPQNQTSWIAMNQDEVIIDKFGHLNTPFALKSYGYWAWEHVAEMLPWEYDPLLPEQTNIPQTAAWDAPDKGHLDAVKSTVWEKKLEVWLKIKVALEKAGISNPRIAIAFIEVATENKATEYYDKACELYYWAFSPGIFRKPGKELVKEIENEIARMAPLLEKKEAEIWQNDLRARNPDLAAKIRTFWLEKDPSPTTTLNERLIEHWERIAFARKNFTTEKNTIYGTDDRGIIYVKYGEPDKKKVVFLGTRRSEINNIASLYDIPPILKTDFRVQIESFINYPECEVWSYAALNSDEPVIYLFGRKEGEGPFGLRNGVEEFIPARAFRNTSLVMGLPPGGIIQMMYYGDLFVFDFSFGARLQEVEEVFVRSRSAGRIPNTNVMRAMRQKYKMDDELNPARRNAPVELSNVNRAYEPIQLLTTRARLLDKDKSRLVFTAFAFPHLRNATSQELLDARFQPEYQTRFTLLLRDAEMNEITRLTAAPFAELDNTAVFELSHEKKQAHYTLAVETYDREVPFDSLDVKRSIGAGKQFFKKLPPLNANPNELEVSDLILGIEPPPGVPLENLPFPLIPSDRIWQVDALKVYLEVYHLKIGVDRTAHFTLDCRVIRLKQKGTKFERKELLATAFDFTSLTPTAKENFGISLANLKPGDYELELEVSDTLAGQKKQRSAPFRILKEE
ncbi:MAG: carboxypeptidase-like regulatory domain-containing protein [bacterium]